MYLPTFAKKKVLMKEWIVVLSLAVALAALITAGAIYFRCRRIRREKNRRIACVLHGQDQLARELEHERIEKQAFERVLAMTLAHAVETNAVPEDDSRNPDEVTH